MLLNNTLFFPLSLRIKRSADGAFNEAESKRQRLDDDIAEETVARILEVINDPKKMLGPEVSVF